GARLVRALETDAAAQIAERARATLDLPAALAVIPLGAARSSAQLQAIVEPALAARPRRVSGPLAIAVLRERQHRLTVAARLVHEDLVAALPARRLLEGAERLAAQRCEDPDRIGLAARHVVDPDPIVEEGLAAARRLARRPQPPDPHRRDQRQKEELAHALY